MLRNSADENQSHNDAPVPSGISDNQHIPFLNNRDIFSLLFQHGKFSELARIRRTCRLANRQFNHVFFEKPDGLLQKLNEMNVTQLRKFLMANARHAESLLAQADHYDAAYASYTLLGDVSLLDPERLPGVLQFLRDNGVSPLIIECVELPHAVFYDRTNDGDYFDEFLQVLFEKYEKDPALGELRLLFLDLLFKTTRSIEKDEILRDQYPWPNRFLAIARSSLFFSNGRGLISSEPAITFFQRLKLSRTPAQVLIDDEIENQRIRSNLADEIAYLNSLAKVRIQS